MMVKMNITNDNPSMQNCDPIPLWFDHGVRHVPAYPGGHLRYSFNINRSRLSDQLVGRRTPVNATQFNYSRTRRVNGVPDRIWEGARISDPQSLRDLSFADHERIFHELLQTGPGVDPTLATALYEVMLDVWQAYDDTVPTLQALKAAGIKICLLSNAGVPIRDVLIVMASRHWLMRWCFLMKLATSSRTHVSSPRPLPQSPVLPLRP